MYLGYVADGENMLLGAGDVCNPVGRALHRDQIFCYVVFIRDRKSAKDFGHVALHAAVRAQYHRLTVWTRNFPLTTYVHFKLYQGYTYRRVSPPVSYRSSE